MCVCVWGTEHSENVKKRTKAIKRLIAERNICLLIHVPQRVCFATKCVAQGNTFPQFKVRLEYVYTVFVAALEILECPLNTKLQISRP